MRLKRVLTAANYGEVDVFGQSKLFSHALLCCLTREIPGFWWASKTVQTDALGIEFETRCIETDALAKKKKIDRPIGTRHGVVDVIQCLENSEDVRKSKFGASGYFPALRQCVKAHRI